MSNPVATISTAIPFPSDPSVVRKTYTMVEFGKKEYIDYAIGEYSTFNPTDKGVDFCAFVPLNDVLSSTKPQFLSDKSWSETLKKARSGFLSPALDSIMPKLMVPSLILVDNGIVTTGTRLTAYYQLTYDLFNWTLNSVNGGSPPNQEITKYLNYAGSPGSMYVSCKAKKQDDASNNTVIVELNQPANPPTGDWQDPDTLVVGGAFCIMLNVTPLQPGGSDPQVVQANPWYVKFEFGEVVMQLNANGSLKVQLTSDSDRTTTANMAEGKAKEGPPQQENIVDRNPYIIIVYPVFNGLVVSSGVQDTTTNIGTTAQYVKKNLEASIMLPPYSNGFDPTSPDDVEVDGTSTDVQIDFGSKMTVTGYQCRFDMAYLPCFFSKKTWLDHWFIANDDVSGDVSYNFKMYSIWTANNTTWTLDPVTCANSGYAGSDPGTHYEKASWRFYNDDDTFHRYAGQIFGGILEVQETRQFPVKNSNGTFSLAWSGGSPGDPSPGSWADYIQNISVSMNIDNQSQGTITLDKYGVAGQTAEVTQCIGGIVIHMTGGNGTTAGNIFMGLAMGTGDNMTAEGAVWTIPLVGLEKKLDDIALVDVPFFDGYRLSQAIDFLCRYAGISYDTSNAPNAFSTYLSATDDINTPRFDWRSGTTVRTALDDVMQDTHHWYVIRDGIMYFYELGDDGLPTILGADWEPSYPNTKVVTIDQNPDFDDLRNEIVVISLDNMKNGQNTNYADLPLLPRIAVVSNTTIPDVPWAKSMIQALPGYLNESKAQAAAQKIAKKAKVYILIGRVSIPGNASIKPYDKWGSFVISSVTHNVDFAGKTWTTDLELSRTTAP